MQRISTFIPVFYTRGVNAPYIEGHIQVVRMITKSLSLHGVKSVIFNFNYRVNESCTDDDFSSRFQIEQKIPYISRENVLSGRNRSIITYSSLMETQKVLKFLLFERALRHRNYVVNIVNCFRYPRIFVKRILGAPIILHFYMPHLRGRCILKSLANRADLVIASSHKVAQYLEKYGVTKKKIAIIYPPVDTELYKPTSKHSIRQKLGLPDEDKIILYMGDLKSERFPEDKVLRVIEELVKDIPETLLLIFTPKSGLNIKRAHEIRKKAKTLNLMDRVEIHVKNLSEKEKADVYAVADIFFFPESGPRVAIDPPLTVLEAMSSGTVVFAPKISSASEIITDNNDGFLFEREDYNALAGRLANLLMNKELEKRVSCCARQAAEQKFSLSIIGAKMLEHFTALKSDQRR